jgi:hypothetical protein
MEKGLFHLSSTSSSVPFWFFVAFLVLCVGSAYVVA